MTAAVEIATPYGLAMTVVIGAWSRFARPHLRSAGDGVPYGEILPKRAGAILVVVP